MNETDLILRQIALERQHAGEVIAACGTALQGAHAPHTRRFLEAALGYLGLLDRHLRWRAAAHAQRLPALRELIGTESELARSLTRAVAEAARAGARCAAPRLTNLDRLTEDVALEIKSYISNLMSYVTSVAELDSLAARSYTISDWRAVAGIDADAVLEERRGYASLAAQGFAAGASAG